LQPTAIAPLGTVFQPEQEPQFEPGGMSVTQVLCILKAYWKYALLTAVSLLLLTAIVVKLLPKSYVATATLIVNDEKKDPLAARDLNGIENTYIPTQIELIQSRVVLQPVAVRLGLNKDPEFVRGFSGPPDALREMVTKNILQSMQVQQGTGSLLLYVSFTAKTPWRAAEIANAIADEYLHQERQRTDEPAGERAARYSEELQELRAKVTAAQDRVTAFRQQHDMVDVDVARGDAEADALAELERRLLATQNARRELEARQLRASTDGADEALDSHVVQQLRTTLAGQESDMAELRSTLGARHPKVLELESQIAATRNSIAREVHSAQAESAIQLSRARDLEAKFASAVSTERQKVLERRSEQEQGAKLLLELQSAQTTYRKALDGYDQIVFASAGNNSTVSLVSRADPPARAQKPNKLKLFLVGIVASLGLAVAGPFGYELFINRRVRCRDDLERSFGIPVLAELGANAGVPS
jgi:uncharacterized protein involved in exopolysaccharide biosynthesis